MEDYRKEKIEVMKAEKEILELYRTLYLKCLMLGTKYVDIENQPKTPKEEADFVQHILDKNPQKIITLTTALMYVDDPTNKESVKKLQSDIQLNGPDSPYRKK